MDTEEFAEGYLGLDLTDNQKALLQEGEGKSIHAIQNRLAKSRVEASAETPMDVGYTRRRFGIDLASKGGDSTTVLVVGAGESVSESIVKHLRSRAAEMGVSVEVVDKMPENISVGLGEEVLKLVRNETAPTASELAESLRELTIECKVPYCDQHDHPVPKHPSKGHHSRTFGGVGRKHFQR